LSHAWPAAHVLVITGPIASGKSTLALAVGRAVEARKARVAVIDLDHVYEMLDVHRGHNGDDRRWDAARRGAAGLTDGFLASGIDVVVVEGEFDEGARAAFAADLAGKVAVRFIALTVAYDEALRRARADPTRGVSRDPAFLRPFFQQYERAAVHEGPVDLMLDTERLSIDRCVEAILGLAGLRYEPG
jgi:energy-coupling factor transporter ATP-binding protein EcfA2